MLKTPVLGAIIYAAMAVTRLVLSVLRDDKVHDATLTVPPMKH